MRWTATAALTVLSLTLSAQRSLGGDAGASILPIPEVRLAPAGTYMAMPDSFSRPIAYGTRAPSQPSLHEMMGDDREFDYASVKPHLAFFCRLELRIEEETRFPVRFRLGEVRGWQQELTKRD